MMEKKAMASAKRSRFDILTVFSLFGNFWGGISTWDSFSFGVLIAISYYLILIINQ